VSILTNKQGTILNLSSHIYAEIRKNIELFWIYSEWVFGTTRLQDNDIIWYLWECMYVCLLRYVYSEGM